MSSVFFGLLHKFLVKERLPVYFSSADTKLYNIVFLVSLVSVGVCVDTQHTQYRAKKITPKIALFLALPNLRHSSVIDKTHS